MKKAKEIINRVQRDLGGFFLVLGFSLIYYLIIHGIFGAFCPLLLITGFPCAGCGLTRAALFLLQGQALRAFRINPSIFLVIAFLLYCGYFRYIKGRPVKGMNMTLGILVAGMLVIYGYRMYLYFPDRAPYVYWSGNLLARWIPLYGRLGQKLLNAIRFWRMGG